MIQFYKTKPKYFFSVILTALILCTVTWKTAANVDQTPDFRRPLTKLTDTVRPIRKDTIPQRPAISDTNRLPIRDTLVERTDTFSLKISKDSLDAPLKYAAQDSAVVLIQEKKIILYGKTKTE